ncbi:MAG: hypothetical protein NTX92_05975 [Euryarchaeota archaeon]|nr:hypothetical protein [Euryarchaeota archaeon]
MKRKCLAIGIILLLSLSIEPIVSGLSVEKHILMEKTFEGNNPPDAPKITGPTCTRPEPQVWTFKAIDPDNDNLSYEIDWGDGVVEKWIGPFASGEEVTRSHTYCAKMTVRIKARANDTHGAIGEWGYLLVVISESKSTHYPPYLQFFERFPNAFPILRFLLEFNH